MAVLCNHCDSSPIGLALDLGEQTMRKLEKTTAGITVTTVPDDDRFSVVN
jgi:hypothetical protein